MKKFIGTFILAAMTAGCISANKQPMSPETKQALEGQVVAQTQRNEANFVAITPGSAMFGLIGAIAATHEGSSITKKNNIQDPAIEISAKLTDLLVNVHKAKALDQKISTTSDNITDVVASVNQKARFIVDVQTMSWGSVYFPLDWSHYRVLYAAKARVIDTEKKTTVAEGFCSRKPESSENAPTFEALTANDAALIKKELSIAIDECIKALSTEMLVM